MNRPCRLVVLISQKEAESLPMMVDAFFWYWERWHMNLSEFYQEMKHRLLLASRRAFWICDVFEQSPPLFERWE